MKSRPGKIINLVSRLALGLCALFSGVNIAFALLGVPRLMPMAFTMTGYLTKYGVGRTELSGSGFFAICAAALAGVVCVTFLLCCLLGGKVRGLLTAAAIIFLLDCVGIGLIILTGGYKAGYWFELAGHAVMLVLFVISFCTQGRREPKIHTLREE